MNFKILPTEVMVHVADGWLTDATIRGAFAAHPYGAASFDHLAEVNMELSVLHQLRNDILSAIERLSEEITSFDGMFARKSRSFHDHLSALESGTDRPERAARYGALRERFFPNGLSIVQRSFMFKGGRIVEIEAAMTTDIMRELEGIQVGEHTLADLYRAWVAAGDALGERIKERLELQASLSRESTAEEEASSTVVRGKWIRAVRTLLSVAEQIEISSKVRRKMLLPLEKSVAAAERRRAESPDEAPDEAPELAGAADSGADVSDADVSAAELGEAAGANPAPTPAEADPAGARTVEFDAPPAGESQASAGESQASASAASVSEMQGSAAEAQGSAAEAQAAASPG